MMDEQRDRRPQAGDVVDEIEVEGHRLVLKWVDVPDDPLPGAEADAPEHRSVTDATGQTQPDDEP